MKKLKLLLTTCMATVLLTSCNKELPNASIEGATFMDYVPIFMMVIGGLSLVYTGIMYATGKTFNGTKLFWFGVGGAISLVVGFVIYAS